MRVKKRSDGWKYRDATHRFRAPSPPLAGSARVFAQKISALVDKKLQLY
jgi:hypothetical protein